MFFVQWDLEASCFVLADSMQEAVEKVCKLFEVESESIDSVERICERSEVVL